MTSMVGKSFRVALALMVVIGTFPAPALGQTHDQQVELAKAKDSGLWRPLAAIGAGMAVIGGALGIGRLASSSVEGIARQPEAGGQIRGAMIITAALIEGVTVIALIVCLLAFFV